MCLGIPGKIISINENENPFLRLAKVSFGGAIKEVSLAYVPQASIDTYVIVHAGFAISVLDENEANKVFEYLEMVEASDEVS